MFNIEEFIAEAPLTTRERSSDIREAVNQGKLYISLINKNGKPCFKLHYLKGGVIKVQQQKVTQEWCEYIKNRLDNIVLSKPCEEYLNK